MNKTTMTAVGRAIWCNLSEPQKPKDGQDGVPKYGITLLFPKNAVTTVTGAAESGIVEIQQALEEVCQGEWQMPFAGAATAMNIPNGFKIKDGDIDYPKKDDRGIPLQPLQPSDNMAGMWVISFRNADPVGCCQPTSVAGVQENIDPAAVYSGCWVRCTVELAAYKGGHGFVLSGKLLNILKCYDDTPIGGGKTVAKVATNDFANVVIHNTNVQHGMNVITDAAAAMNAHTPAIGQDPLIATPGATHSIESLRTAKWTVEQIVAGGYATLRPIAPPTPPTPPSPSNLPVVEAVLTSVPGQTHTVEQLRAAKWTDQQIIDGGFGTMVMATPAAPTLPAPATPPTPPTPPAPATPPTPPAPATPPTPPTPPASELTMIAGCQYTYAQLKPTYTDQQMVDAGYALAPSFRDPSNATPPPPPAA